MSSGIDEARYIASFISGTVPNSLMDDVVMKAAEEKFKAA